MTTRVCLLGSCDEPVLGRKRYCGAACRAEAEREQEQRYEALHRDERNAARRESRAQGKHPDRADMPVVDYCASGAANRPPQFPGVATQPKPTRQTEVRDGRVPHPRDRITNLDMSRVPAIDRHDLVKAQRMAVQDSRTAEDDLADMMSWDDLMTRSTAAADDRRVSFPPAPGSPALTGMLHPQPRYDHLGRPYARARRWG